VFKFASDVNVDQTTRDRTDAENAHDSRARRSPRRDALSNFQLLHSPTEESVMHILKVSLAVGLSLAGRVFVRRQSLIHRRSLIHASGCAPALNERRGKQSPICT